MSIELKQAAEKALVVLGSATSFMSRKARDQHESVVAELRTALSQQPATPEPVLFIHPDTFAMNNAQVGAWKPGYELTSYIPLYTHPAPGVPDGLQWFTVDEHGLPEVGETVIGGLWYTDPWLKPDRATYFMWGQCSVIAEKHHDFKEGKRWLTFGPSHNQITHWARLTPPAMLAAPPAQKDSDHDDPRQKAVPDPA